ncbi:MAG: helix-turn-helix domain-containing protein [Pseudonocardiaceae bacterium]
MDVPPQVLAALTSEQGHAAVSAGDTGTVLRLVRKKTGMHQSEIAARSGYSQPTISRAERGQISDPVVLADIADVLGVPHDALGLPGAGNPAAPTLDDMERREMLKGILAVASAALLPAQIVDAAAGGNKKIGAADVQQCVDALRRLYEMDYVSGGRPVYELTASMASRLRDTVGRAAYGPAVGRKLRGVAAATYENAGWQAYDAGDFGAAHRWWLETLHLSNLGEGAEDAKVIALTSMSLEASERGRRGHEAVDLAHAAQKTAGDSATPALRSLLAAREGIGHAVSGNQRASAGSFQTARQWLDRTHDQNEPEWLAFWGPADLSWHEMTAARAAGKPAVAETAATTAISHADPETMPRNHAIYTASLGHTLAQAGRYEEAITVSRDVLANPATKGSSRPVAELQATARVLSLSTYPQARSFGATVAKLTGAR